MLKNLFIRENLKEKEVKKMKKILVLASLILLMTAAIILSGTGLANAHLVAFGWKDNGNGTITMFGEHWHGDQVAPSTANGGVRIGVYGTDDTLWPVFQWTGFFNNQGGTLAGMDAMVTAGTLDGYAVEPNNFCDLADDNDWFFTDPLVLGNGTWGLFTGTNCCIDTMSAPGQFVITGIISVPPGTGPGDQVPEPSTILLLGSGLIGLGFATRKRFKKQLN